MGKQPPNLSKELLYSSCLQDTAAVVFGSRFCHAAECYGDSITQRLSFRAVIRLLLLFQLSNAHFNIARGAAVGNECPLVAYGGGALLSLFSIALHVHIAAGPLQQCAEQGTVVDMWSSIDLAIHPRVRVSHESYICPTVDLSRHRRPV